MGHKAYRGFSLSISYRNNQFPIILRGRFTSPLPLSRGPSQSQSSFANLLRPLKKCCSRSSQGHICVSRPTKPPQEAPKRPPRRPKRAPRRPKRPPRSPKRRASNQPKRPPRRPQEAQKTAKERPEGAQKPKKRAPNASLKKNWFWDQFWTNFGAPN